MSGAEPTAASVRRALRERADPADALALARFFKTGPGQYGEGDVFLGVRVPATRAVVTAHRGLPLDQIGLLLESEFHEDRLAGLLALVALARQANSPRRGDAVAARCLAEFYLDALRRGRVNNWDLIDSSAEFVVGEWLYQGGEPVPDALIESSSIWERRAAMLATFAFLKHGDASETIRVATRLLDDAEDLIQKAVGWMLRELGKRVSRDRLIAYLEENAQRMRSVTLSYTTEHLDPDLRAEYRRRRRSTR